MSSVDFLLTPSMQKVLGFVLAQPERDFTLQDLLVKAGGGRGSSQRQIERLIESGVLAEGERRGRQRSIKANTSYFLFPELHSIALKSFALAEPLRQALKPYEQAIDEAFVFGSVARSEDSHRSDIDLIVVGHASLMDLTSAMFEVEQLLGRPVNLNLYTPEEWARLRVHDPVVAQISESSRIQVLPDATSTRVREPAEEQRV